jgi:SulP family sulfate permease
MDTLDEDNDSDARNLKDVPKNTLVFEVSGPMFFGAADKLIQLTNQVTEEIKVVVVRMRSVPSIDITAMNSLKKVQQQLAKNDVTMVFSHVLEQPLKAMRKAGFVDAIGNENICENLDAALDRADKLSA